MKLISCFSHDAAQEQGNLTLENALILGAAVVLAISALPAFVDGMNGYLSGFTETENIATTE